MPLIPILIPPGLERNGTPYDSPQAWWDMSLMRWVSGSARGIGGWDRKTPTPLDSAIRRFHAWQDNSGTRNTMVGTDGRLYVDYGGVWTNITPTLTPPFLPPVVTSAGGYGSGPYGAGTYGTPRPPSTSGIFSPRFGAWSFATWGEDVLIISSEDNRLLHYIQASPTTPPVVVTGAPTANAVGVTDERHVMVVGPTIAGTYYPHRIAWCSTEDLTDWDFASLTNTAGFLDLTCTSPLNWIIKVREGMLVFSSTEVFLVTYTGLPYVYGQQKLAEMPIYHPYSIAAFGGGRACWFSPLAFQLYAGNQVQPLPCPIFNDIVIDFSAIWGALRCHSSGNGSYPEVWFHWPSVASETAPTGQGECDRYAVYNFLDGWWGWGYLQRSAMISAGPIRLPLMGTFNGTIYEHEQGWDGEGLDPSDRWLESGALGINNGEQIVDVNQAMLASTDKLHPTGQRVLMEFFARYTPDGEETVFGPYTPRADGYTDLRVSAREARIRYIGNVNDLFDIGLLRLDVSATGGRR